MSFGGRRYEWIIVDDVIITSARVIGPGGNPIPGIKRIEYSDRMRDAIEGFAKTSAKTGKTLQAAIESLKRLRHRPIGYDPPPLAYRTQRDVYPRLTQQRNRHQIAHKQSVRMHPRARKA